MTGSLGLLGRAKRIGLVSTIRPWITRLVEAGVPYDPDLLRTFLSAMGE